MGKFPEADAEIAKVWICLRCKTRNHRGAKKCRKCGSRSTSYYEVQTRSADEPMTQFITCLDCNNRWKQ